MVTAGIISFFELNEIIVQEIADSNIVYSKDQAPPDTNTLKWSDKSRKQFNKKLPPDWRDKIRKAINDFLSGRSKHNDHPLKGNRAGQRALDIPDTGPGRGTGRIVYEPIIKGGITVGIKIIEFITDHKYEY
jgi:phage-related protein